MKAIITDDEEAARNVLAQLLEHDHPSIEVLAKCNDLPSAIKAIETHKPDVVFLDVQMPEYAGYEIVDLLETIDFEIIFVTAYDHYAIKAFELNAVDYLVKPINRKRLAQSIEKLSQKVVEKTQLEQYRQLKQTLEKKTFDTIVISELGKQHILKLADIIAFEAYGAYSRVYLSQEKMITVSKNIKHFEVLLEENPSFFRAHKSWLIHLDHLKSYSKLQLDITLSEGVVAKLSKYKKADFELAIKL